MVFLWVEQRSARVEWCHSSPLWVPVSGRGLNPEPPPWGDTLGPSVVLLAVRLPQYNTAHCLGPRSGESQGTVEEELGPC